MPENQGSKEEREKLAHMPLGEISEEYISVAELQRRIMPDPDRAETFGDFDIFGTTLPMSIVGGDFYDFIDLESRFGIKNRMGIVIADASGHGLVAAMLIRDFNTALFMGISMQSYYVRDTTPLLFVKMNRRMYRSSQPNQYISAFYGELRLSGLLRYMNAGHYDPLLFSETDVVHLNVGGPVLGAFRDAPGGFAVGEVQMKENDILVTYTDGIIEALDQHERQYGVDRLKEVVSANRNRSAREVFDIVMEDVSRYSREIGQTDDRTLQVIKKTTPGSGAGQP